MQILQNTSLKAFNTFGIDVKASLFTQVKTIQELQWLVQQPAFKENRRLILGGGSNILFTKDFEGLIVNVFIKGIELINEDKSNYYVSVMGGENWHQFVLHSIAKGWQGMENLSLIPGTVGAAPIQNIGAYGVEVSEFIHEVKALELATGTIKSFDAQTCKFGYRNSIFKQELKGRFIIYEVIFKLNKVPTFCIEYAPLKSALKNVASDNITAKQISEVVITIRQSKLPDPEKIGNCGSFFKNPIVPRKVAEQLQVINPNMPQYSVNSDYVKIPAGWLIEKSGLKGYKSGQVGTFEKQALVMVNLGKATGEEAYLFAKSIISKVKANFKITLEPEVNIL